MRTVKFLFLIIFVLEVRGEGLILNQGQAILGEPVIIEVKEGDFFSFDKILFLQGPTTLCIELSKYQGKERINLVDLFKVEGEYEISIISSDEICNLKKEVEALKMDFEGEGDERRKGYLEISLKYKEQSYKKALEGLKKEADCKIKINYPVDFDKYLYLNYFKDRENLDDFWHKGLYEKETREEFLKIIKEAENHPESNYFPWFIYVAFNNNLSFHLNPENPIYKDMNKKHKGKIVGDEKFLKDFMEKLDLVIENWGDFIFIDEIYLERGFLGYFGGEDAYKVKEFFKNAYLKGKHKEVKEISERFLKKLEKN